MSPTLYTLINIMTFTHISLWPKVGVCVVFVLTTRGNVTHITREGFFKKKHSCSFIFSNPHSAIYPYT